MTLNKWFEKWKTLSLVNAKVRTKKLYSYYFNHHIKNRLGKLKIERIREDDVQNFVLDMAKHYATSTINGCFRLVKTCLTDFYEKYDIKSIRFAKIKIPNVKIKQVDCFSIKEQKNIENCLNLNKSPKQIGILLTLYTGLRLGELLALEWKNVELDKKLIHIKSSVYYSNAKFIYTTPKTKSSIREIPLPTFLVNILKEIKKLSKSNFVVADKYGKAIIPRTYQYEFEMLLKKCGISHKGFHSLRHTFATRALECGMDIKSLADILGHANPMITLKRYTHSMLEYKMQMMNKLGKIYQNNID
jgi:integrase